MLWSVAIACAVMLEVGVTGMFYGIYRVRWATRHPQSPADHIEIFEPVFAGIFWPIYLLALVLMGCFCFPNWVARQCSRKKPSVLSGITSTGEYRRMKQMVEEYEARLPVGER